MALRQININAFVKMRKIPQNEWLFVDALMPFCLFILPALRGDFFLSINYMTVDEIRAPPEIRSLDKSRAYEF